MIKFTFFVFTILIWSQPLLSQDEIVISSCPDTIEYGNEFSISAQFIDNFPQGNSVQIWNWHIISWCFDRLDTLLSYSINNQIDSCTWNNVLNLSDLCDTAIRYECHYAFIITTIIDSEDDTVSLAKKVFLWDNPLSGPGCCFDDLIIYEIPKVLSPNLHVSCKAIYDDADLSGDSIDYWSWEIVLLTNQGCRTISSVDSLFGHNSSSYMTNVDSADIQINWIFTDTRSIPGFIVAYSINSIGQKYYDTRSIEYVDKTANFAYKNVLPYSFKLYQNYPNPFNPYTFIEFDLNSYEHINLSVYNSLGELIETLVDSKLGPGRFELKWKTQDLSSGTYYYRLTSGKQNIVRKCILLK
jgi:hypothetical protein